MKFPWFLDDLSPFFYVFCSMFSTFNRIKPHEAMKPIFSMDFPMISIPIGSMYGIYANIGGILMVNVTIYSSTMDPMG